MGIIRNIILLDDLSVISPEGLGRAYGGVKNVPNIVGKQLCLSCDLLGGTSVE